MSVCPNCGRSVNDNAKFCEHCGRKLSKKEGVRAGSGQKILVVAVVVLAIVAIALGAMVATRSDPRNDANAVAQNAARTTTSESATAKAEVPTVPQVSYTWSHESSGGEDSASTDIWYPVFSTDAGNTAATDAINADVQQQVQTARDSLASWKPWAYVCLYPEVTLVNDEYVAVHYFHVYDAGTTGTLSIAGEGALYSLADGGKEVSPAVMIGHTDEELRNIANEAVEYSGVRGQAIYQNDLAQMLSEGTAGYVVLSDGIYVYLRGADASNRSSQSFHLVRVCDYWGNALETPVVIDLASNQQLSYYRDLKRDGTTSNAAGGNAGR